MKEHELVHLLPDVLKFSSEQDIKKWREERRKYVGCVSCMVVLLSYIGRLRFVACRHRVYY